MKLIIFVVGSVLIVFGLMVLQLRFMKKYHPNAELLIDMLKLLNSDSAKE
jgi:hypothetical protein